MLKSSLCYFSDAYILVIGTITVPNTGGASASNNRSKEVVFKNCAPFTDCISEINYTQIDNTKDIDVIINRCNLIEYSENYLQTSRRLWQYYRYEPALNDYDSIIHFPANDDTSLSFGYKKI